MYWIVQIENPKPEVYIPIFVYQSFDNNRFQDEKRFKIFDVESEAVSYAKGLLEQFKAQSIRLFYQEGHSEKLR